MATENHDAAARFDPTPQIATELEIPAREVAAVVRLLADGNTVPFIARYRKEATGDLDEVQIRAVEERHGYLRELAERRQTILGSIQEQGKLTAELRARILAVSTKAALEDLYLPYKPKRRTRATIARERGLEPLADWLRELPPTGDPAAVAAGYVAAEKGVPDAEAALQGARDIIAESVAEQAAVRALVRQAMQQQGHLVAVVVPDRAEQPTKFEQYYDYRERLRDIPSHRYLAIRRGEREGVLRVHVAVDGERLVGRICQLIDYRHDSPCAPHLRAAIEDAYDRLLHPSVETEVRVESKVAADQGAVEVFATNLRELLLAAPLGDRSVIGIDPGIRTGCKCVSLTATGKFTGHVTIYLQQGAAKEERARADLVTFVKQAKPFAVAIGNGTGGRETEAFARRVLREAELGDIVIVQVNEAGASVYSASTVARDEFPDLDLTLRGAISIARRLQDPLAELVKIDPKSIGVGQYQHDVHQPLLQRKLDEVVESCVNRVGVEANTASASLLGYVAGIGPALAKRIVAHREEHGPYPSRRDLLEVSGLGRKTFEQAAGFLRVRGGRHALDASAVHPERYALVERISADLGVGMQELVGNRELARKIDITGYVDDQVGELTLRDIVEELERPGRDPRDTFEPPRFREDVQSMEDLEEGMTLEGVVTNVTAFGAFVDVGVHQDGLVHISQLADHFVEDPHREVRVGQRLQVRVLSVDQARGRIGLSARGESGAGQRGGKRPSRAGG